MVKNQDMSRFKAINILDTLFVCVSVLLIVFSLIQFFVGSFLLSLLLAIVVTASLIFIYKAIKNKINTKKQLNEKEKQDTELYFYNFALLPQNKQLAIIKKFVPSSKNPIIKSRHVECDGKIILFSSALKDMDKCSFIELAKSFLNTKKEIVIFAYNYSKETIDLAENLNNSLTLLDKNNFYLLCKNNNINFKNKNKNNPKIKIKDIFINFFNKKHAKGYFFSGLLLIFTSFIIPFKNYYLFFGIILLIFSIICRIKKQDVIKEFKF